MRCYLILTNYANTRFLILDLRFRIITTYNNTQYFTVSVLNLYNNILYNMLNYYYHLAAFIEAIK